MGKSASAPPAPDYAGAAAATAAGNLEAARAAAAANRVNQVTPYGSLTYTHTGRGFNQAGYDQAMQSYQDALKAYNSAQFNVGTTMPNFLGKDTFLGPSGFGGGPTYGSMFAPVAPKYEDFYTGSPDDGWTATQTLAPAQQALLDQQNKISLGLAGLADQGLGYVKNALANQITLGSLPKSMVDPGQTGQDALMARFQPQIDQSRAALENKLANQGIMPGSEAYTNAMRQQYQSENDLRMQAALNGISVGEKAQNQQLQLLTALQNQPLNMLNAVRTGSQVTNPSFVSVPQQATTAGPDLLGAAGAQNQYNMGLYNSQVGQQNSAMGGLFGLGSSLLMGGPVGLLSMITK
jgi:hypothetical protein